MLDMIIKNGMVIDGTGAKAYASDIGISKGKIVQINSGISEDAKQVIDAAGLCICPGFIDGHAHNDGYIFHDPSAISKLSQGVTTEISGNCGEGLAPVSEKYFQEIYDYYKPYYPPSNLKNFKTHQYYFNEVDQLNLGINIGYYCAHGTIRMAVMGFERRRPTEVEMNEMKAHLKEGLDCGCLGMSSGLIYAPGCYSDKEELIELCKILKEYGAVYASHIRNEGFNLIPAVQEVIDIAKASGVTVIISHLKVMGTPNWGQSEQVLKMIDNANRAGCNIYFDQYPYTYSCSVLYSIFPVQYLEGGVSKLVEKLQSTAVRKELRDLLLSEIYEGDNPIRNYTFAGIHILTAEHVPEAQGKTLEQFAHEIGNDPLETLFDIVVKSGGNALGAFDCMCEEDIIQIMNHPRGMIGSDGIAVFPHELTHPRLYGTFPKVLGEYVREKGILRLEKAIEKMTSLPANIIGLPGKGCLKVGYDADITVFDSEQIKDMSTLENSQLKSKGVHYVIVNGQIALSDGKYTDTTSGRNLFRSKRSML